MQYVHIDIFIPTSRFGISINKVLLWYRNQMRLHSILHVGRAGEAAGEVSALGRFTEALWVREACDQIHSRLPLV